MKKITLLALLALYPSCQVSYGGNVVFHEPLVLTGLEEGKSSHYRLLFLTFGDSSVDAAAHNGDLADVRYSDTTHMAFPLHLVPLFEMVTTTVKGASNIR